MKQIGFLGITLFILFSLNGCAPQIENTLTSSLKNLGKSSNFKGEEKNRYDYDMLAKKYKEENKTSDLLWDYEAGVINQYTKNYKKSNNYFDIAENMIKKYDKEIMASKALANIGSLLTNDTFLDYRPKIYEKIMVNTLKGINFMALGDKKNARIEFNRALVREQRAKMFFKKEIEKIRNDIKNENKKELKKNKQQNSSLILKSANHPKTREAIEKQYTNLFAFKAYRDFVNPFSTYISALYFYNVKDYRKAADLFKESYAMIKGIDSGDKIVKRDWLTAIRAKKSIRFRKRHYTWVIFLNGEGPIKKEIRIDVPLFLISKNVNYTGIALPTIELRKKAFENLKISNKRELAFTKPITSMDRIIKAEFKKRFPTIVTRALLRTITQTVIQKQINDRADKINSTLGLLTKFTASAYQAVMNRADTRIWDRLPKEFQVARIKTRKEISIFAEGKKIANIKTDPNKNYIIFVQIPKKEIKPIISTISI